MSIDHPDFASPLVAGSNILYNNAAFSVPAGGQAQSGAIDVSSFAQVFITVTNAAMVLGNFQTQYFADLGLTKVVGTSPIWWKSGTGTVNMFLAVQGPVLNFVANNSDASARTLIVRVFGVVNVTSPGLIVPSLQIASLNQAGVAQNGTATVQSAPGMNADVLWAVNSNLGPAQGRVDVWNGSAWNFVAFLSLTANNLGGSQRITLPFSDTRIVVTNLNAGAAVLQSSFVGPAL